MNPIDYNIKVIDMAFESASKPLTETEQKWGDCEGCNQRRLLEVPYIFNDGEWEKNGPALCRSCSEK